MNDIDWKSWLILCNALATAGISVTIWLRKPGEEAGAAVSALRELIVAEVAALRLVQTTLEERMRHVPSRDAVHELDGDVKAIKATLQGLTGMQQAQSSSLSRIESYLLQRGKS